MSSESFSTEVDDLDFLGDFMTIFGGLGDGLVGHNWYKARNHKDKCNLWSPVLVSSARQPPSTKGPSLTPGAIYPQVTHADQALLHGTNLAHLETPSQANP